MHATVMPGPPDQKPRRSFGQRLLAWASAVKRDSITLWFAARDRRTPWLPKAIAIFVVAYALSPIDLIPDVIPVIGYLDDALLLPGLIWLAIRLTPAPIVADCRGLADEWIAARRRLPRSQIAAVVIVGIWTALAVSAAVWLWSWR